MHRLDIPAGFYESDRQPVEQLRMRRAFAIYAKIAWCANDPGAEVTLPNAIHHDSRSQRVVSTGDPFRQSNSVATRRKLTIAICLEDSRLALTGEDTWESGLDNFSGLIVVASNQNACGRDIGTAGRARDIRHREHF